MAPHMAQRPLAVLPHPRLRRQGGVGVDSIFYFVWTFIVGFMCPTDERTTGRLKF
jgi:hypothetical protein